MGRKDIRLVAKERVLLLDGAMGTQIHSFGLGAEDFGGEAYVGCNEHLNLTRPDVIAAIHDRYLEAGADIIETNSLCSSKIELEEFGLGDLSYDVARAAAEIARGSADRFSTEEKPRFVAGNIGSTNKLLNLSEGIDFDGLKAMYKPLVKGLVEGGADVILFETYADTSNLKAGLLALDEVYKELDVDLPVMISVTIESNGTMLAGQTLEALYASVRHFKPFAVGINCGLGPGQAVETLDWLVERSDFLVSLYPNAGLPDENGQFTLGAEDFATELKPIIQKGQVNIIGGCCGTTPDHIRKLGELVAEAEPRKVEPMPASLVSGLELVEFMDQNRPVMIGERTNMSGSKKFRKLIRGGEFDQGSDIGKLQVLGGAQILDVNLADTESDESDNIANFFPLLLKKVKAPLMIDSSSPAAVIEGALKLTQGKCLINSINLEDEARFREVALLAGRYGAALIVLLIDEKEMAVTLEQKLDVAERSYRMLVDELGVMPEDIVFDPLVFAVGSGDQKFFGCAKATIEAVAELKKRYPQSKTSLGISNVSYGLPSAGREALNAAMLYHSVQAGLDMAIVNSEKIVRYATLSDDEKQLCREMLYNNSGDVVKQFIGYYGTRKVKAKTAPDHSQLPLEERLHYYIVEGLKQGLVEDLDEALKSHGPLDIVNRFLMAGMAAVGKRFNARELTVIEVLQSAEVMKTAVEHLEQFMEPSETVSKGKLLLATVKGDVHDIGKNLVEMVISNNGYEVVDLGINVDNHTLIEGIKKHQPDAVGLSGLLVRSAHQMQAVAADLKAEGIDIPVLVGGAALSRSFTENKLQPDYTGKVLYAADAVDGLQLMEGLGREKSSPTPEPEPEERTIEADNPAGLVEAVTVEAVEQLPEPKDFELHRLEFPFENVFGTLNRQMLYGKHFGLKGVYDNMLEEGNRRAVELTETVDVVKRRIEAAGIAPPQGVYTFFKAKRRGDGIVLLDIGERELGVLEFPRQETGKRLCLADYVAADRVDSVALFCVTAGSQITELANRHKYKKEYATSHIVYSLALEAAEAAAQLAHRQIREDWGIGDRGCRYSPGYSAFPRLEAQKDLFRLLDIEAQLGITLTESMMMAPEASVTALVLHHPQAEVFHV
jgi:5-methyltetrahydrofolate--homocysteine methyltransferase